MLRIRCSTISPSIEYVYEVLFLSFEPSVKRTVWHGHSFTRFMMRCKYVDLSWEETYVRSRRTGGCDMVQATICE